MKHDTWLLNYKEDLVNGSPVVLANGVESKGII